MDLILPIRALQLLFAIITLGLTAYSSSDDPLFVENPRLTFKPSCSLVQRPHRHQLLPRFGLLPRLHLCLDPTHRCPLSRPLAPLLPALRP